MDRETAEYQARRRSKKGEAFRKWVETAMAREDVPLPLTEKPDAPARKTRRTSKKTVN
jgi:hypothetical protein